MSHKQQIKNAQRRIETAFVGGASHRAIQEAFRRDAKLVEFNKLIEGGQLKHEAAKAVGVAIPTLWRWRKMQAEYGFAGLVPTFGNRGRRKKGKEGSNA